MYKKEETRSTKFFLVNGTPQLNKVLKFFLKNGNALKIEETPQHIKIGKHSKIFGNTSPFTGFEGFPKKLDFSGF